MMSVEENPLISIIVPVYAVEKYLDQCVQSLVNQSYRSLEIILVDDGSKDQCPAICDRWSESDSRIKVIHKENGGLSDARNAGIHAANGKYIAFVDSDDWIDISFIENLYKAMRDNDSDIAECSVQYVSEEGEVLKIRYTNSLNNKMDRISALKNLVEGNGIYQTVWNKLYKRNVIQGLWFETGRFHEDEFWTYQVFDNIESIILVEQPLYYYRQRSTSIMGKSYSIKRLDGLLALAERYDCLKKYPELESVCYEQFMMGCIWNLQAALRNLKNDDKEYAIEYILSLSDKNKSDLKNIKNLKNRFWIRTFKSFPVMTAKIRNKLGIGL